MRRDREATRSTGLPADRPRKIGLAWQQLRASASILIDWILAAERNGWFGTPPRNHRKVVTRTASDAVDRLHRMREDRGLHHTGTRYPGHGRKRPKHTYKTPARTGPPDDPPAVADPDDDPIPF